MRKKIIIICLIILFIILIKFFISDYKINYKVNDYNITTTYKDGRYYINIDNKYSFDIYSKRKLLKLKIKDIQNIENEKYSCILPIIKGIDTKPLCYVDDEYIDYNLIDDEAINKYKNVSNNKSEGHFYFNENLNKTENIALWNYTGFYKMNFEELENIIIFKEGKYDNSLMYQINNKILLPDYNEEYIFKNMYVYNINNGKYDIISSKYEISYNSYVVGNIKNKVYLFDMKELKLYEISLNKMSIKLIGSEEIGFTKIVKSKQVSAKLSEYKNKEINYNKEYISNYKYEVIDNKLYKNNLEDDLKLKIFDGKEINIISEYKNNLYFTSEDKFYIYNSIDGIRKIFNYFELNFNKNKIIYINNK